MQLLVRSTVLTPHYTLFQLVIVDNLVISNCSVVDTYDRLWPLRRVPIYSSKNKEAPYEKSIYKIYAVIIQQENLHWYRRPQR